MTNSYNLIDISDAKKLRSKLHSSASKNSVGLGLEVRLDKIFIILDSFFSVVEEIV